MLLAGVSKLRVATETKIRSYVISIFLLVTGVIMTSSGYYLFRSSEDFVIERYQRDFINQNSAIASMIDGNQHQTIISRKSRQFAAYKRFQAAIRRLLAKEQAPEFMFTLNYFPRSKALSYAVDVQQNSDKQPLHQPGSNFDETREFKTFVVAVLEGKQHDALALIPSQRGMIWLTAAPIKNAKGEVIGALVSGISNQKMQSLGDAMLGKMIIGFAILAIGLLISAIWFARKITRPIEQLDDAIKRLIKSDFNYRLSEQSFGRFDYIAHQFNLMLSKLHASRSEMIKLNKAYSRFVPHQLLKQLSPAGVKEIELGDSCERLMTVLFCDIRGFTTLSETMSPQANFQFINRYLNQIAPVINKHNGIIDKYLGDGIMALFPTADEAVSSGIEILTTLNVYNQRLREANLAPIKVGLGLHTGMMMMGAVGTNQRMDITVVSDTVNAAARVESMTKAFGTDILISGETKKQLQDLSRYKIRYIAHTRIQGKNKPVTLYEVFDHDEYSLQEEKSHNQKEMIRAWKLYREGFPQKAIAIYSRLLEKTPDDRSLMALIERCQSGRL